MPLKKYPQDVEVFEDPNLIKKYSKLVLPGVGSFKAGMNLLVEKNGMIKSRNL